MNTRKLTAMTVGASLLAAVLATGGGLSASAAIERNASASETGVLVAASTIDAAAPELVAPSKTTGDPVVGETLSVSSGEWNVNDLEFSYQWYRMAKDSGSADELIVGANEPKYTTTASDAGRVLIVDITASAPGLPDGKTTGGWVFVKYPTAVSVKLERYFTLTTEEFEVPVSVATDAHGEAEGTVSVSLDGEVVVAAELEPSDEGMLSLFLPKHLEKGVHALDVSFVSPDGLSASSEAERLWLWVAF